MEVVLETARPAGNVSGGSRMSGIERVVPDGYQLFSQLSLCLD